jgi:hypothetical protein
MPAKLKRLDEPHEVEAFEFSFQFTEEEAKAFEANPRETMIKVLRGALQEVGINEINGLSVPYGLADIVKQSIAAPQLIHIIHCIKPCKSQIWFYSDPIDIYPP